MELWSKKAVLRNYHIRLAVVCMPGSVRLSSRFGDMLAEERWRTEGSAGSCSIGP